MSASLIMSGGVRRAFGPVAASQALPAIASLFRRQHSDSQTCHCQWEIVILAARGVIGLPTHVGSFSLELRIGKPLQLLEVASFKFEVEGKSIGKSGVDAVRLADRPQDVPLGFRSIDAPGNTTFPQRISINFGAVAGVHIGSQARLARDFNRGFNLGVVALFRFRSSRMPRCLLRNGPDQQTEFDEDLARPLSLRNFRYQKRQFGESLRHRQIARLGPFATEGERAAFARIWGISSAGNLDKDGDICMQSLGRGPGRIPFHRDRTKKTADLVRLPTS